MSSTNLTGRCLCGAVRYALTQAPVWAHNCHCSRCRKSSGAAFASNLFFPREALRYTQGEDALRSFKLPAAERFTHVFCGVCGSTLPFVNEQRGLVGIPMGSLDADPRFSPRAHIFTDSRAPWFSITDTLPQHPAALGSAPDPPGE